jgi:hypothetical protein
MKSALVVALVLACGAITPASAHSWSPLGWSGPWSGGEITDGHPERFCNDYAAYTCIVAGTQTFGIPLTQWRIDVWNSAGLNTTYLTNTRGTPGWIVVIGVTGLTWGIQPMGGTYEGVTCQMFQPGSAGGFASVNWGSSRFFYQAVFNGSFGGSLCRGAR